MISRVCIMVRVRVRVRFMVWVRGKCPGGECPGEMFDTRITFLSTLSTSQQTCNSA